VPARREAPAGTLVSGMPPDADMQLEASGSIREVKVDMSTVISGAYPRNHSIGRPAPRVAYADSRMSLPSIGKGQLKPSAPGVPNVSV
jgi:hypothetical protein